MRKIFLIVFCFISLGVFGQFPNNQSMGNDSTLVTIKAAVKGNKGIVNGVYADTTAANLSRIRNYQFAQIATTSDSSLWIRNVGATRWMKIASSVGSTNIYNSNGTLTGNRDLAKGGFDLLFSGNGGFRASTNTSDITLDADGVTGDVGITAGNAITIGTQSLYFTGIPTASTSSDSVFVKKASDGKMTFRAQSAIVGTTPTWQQTLTAGSTMLQNNTIAGGGFNFTLNNLGNYDFNMANTKQFRVFNAGTIYLESLNGGGTTYLEGQGGAASSFWDFHAEDLAANVGDLGIQNDLIQIYLNNSGKYNEIRIRDTMGFLPHLGRIYIDTLRAATIENTLMAWRQGGVDQGRVGYVTLGSGLSLSSGVLNTSGTVPTPISSLTAATQTNSINNANYQQTWSWSTLGGNAIEFSTNSTASGSSSSVLNIRRSGTHAGTPSVTYGLYVDNLHFGSSNNVAAIFDARNGTNNYAIIVPASSGSVGIGTSAPTSLLHVNGVAQIGTAGSTLGQILMSGNTSGTVTLQTAAAAGTYTLTLPTTDGNANEFLQTNGSGVLTWAAAGGGTPAGNFGNVQIGRNGAFDTPASDSLDFESATGLSVKGDVRTTTSLYLPSSSSEGLRFGTTVRMYDNGSLMRISPTAGTLQLFTSGSNAIFDIYNSAGDSYIHSAPLSGTGSILETLGSATNLRMQTTAANTLAIGNFAGTAKLHVAAGTTTLAPFKLTTGTSLTTAEAGAMEYTTPQLFFTNGRAVRQEIPQIQQSRVSTQFDKTSDVTLANITGLTTSVAASGTYRFEAVLYTTSNVAGGVKFAIAGTATATNIIYEAVVIDANVNAAQTRATALATAVGGVTAVTNALCKITGTITVNAAGTLTCQFAQNASNGTASSVLVGSTFVITEML